MTTVVRELMPSLREQRPCRLTRRPGRALPADAAHPALRGARLLPLPRGGDPGNAAPVPGPGGGRRRRLRRARAVGLDHLDAPAPRARAREGRQLSRAAMAELYGKATGCCRGRGGSMHLGDPDVGMPPAIAIVGGGNTVVTGIGLAFKLRRTGRSRSASSATERVQRGGVPRRAQLRRRAAACRSSSSARTTCTGRRPPFDRVSLLPDVATRAAAYGIPGAIVDGMDVLAVRDAATAAVAVARSGRGADPARVQDLPLRRAQPQRRARVPDARGRGGVEGSGTRSSGCGSSRPGRCTLGRGGRRGGARRRRRVRAGIALPRPGGGARRCLRLRRARDG